MHVIVVNDFAHVNGGAAKIAILASLGLAQSSLSRLARDKNGVQVTFFSAVAPQMPELEAAGIRVICLGQQEILQDPDRVRAARQGLWNARAARAMAELLSSCDPRETVVHVHGWVKALSSSPIRVAVQRGFKVVVTLHDYFIACPNGGFYNYQTREICTLQPLSAACLLEHCDSRSYAHKIWRVVRQGVQQRLGGLPGGVQNYITYSPLSRQVLEPYLPAGARLFHVDNPVEMPSGQPADPGASQAFVFVGRMSPEKGAVLLAQAAAQCGAALTFVGDGACRAEALAACPGATVTGWLPASAVRGHLQQARALVLPSLWYETFALVVQEALALGLPVLVPETCAAREYVRDGQTGFWFRRGDVEDLAQKMRRLMDPTLARQLGRAAYEQYWSHPLTLQNHLEQLLACYTAILASD